VCEVWKWIAVATAIPVAAVLVVDATKWRDEPTRRWVEWWAPRLRFWWLAVFVLFFSASIYVVHCE
jgi:hypothetical protein